MICSYGDLQNLWSTGESDTLSWMSKLHSWKHCSFLSHGLRIQVYWEWSRIHERENTVNESVWKSRWLTKRFIFFFFLHTQLNSQIILYDSLCWFWSRLTLTLQPPFPLNECKQTVRDRPPVAEEGIFCRGKAHRHTLPRSRLLALSLLTCDSAMSALSWASSSSCCTFLYLHRWVLACSSCQDHSFNFYFFNITTISFLIHYSSSCVTLNTPTRSECVGGGMILQHCSVLYCRFGIFDTHHFLRLSFVGFHFELEFVHQVLESGDVLLVLFSLHISNITAGGVTQEGGHGGAHQGVDLLFKT